MKLQLASFVFLLATSVTAHSWVDCVQTNVTNYAEAKANPAEIMPKNDCLGYPRNKVNHTEWVDESTWYAWNLNHAEINKDNLACNPRQTNTYPSNRPKATAKPGDSLMMTMWGNGHVRGDWGLPKDTDPGLVRIYWRGQKEAEIIHKDELTELNWMKGAQANFSADAWSVHLPDGRPDDKASYFHLEVPKKIENGRHMMVWAWAPQKGLLKNRAGWKQGDYDNEWIDVWSTCFDIEIEGSNHSGPTYSGEEKKELEDVLKSSSESICKNQSCRKGGNAAYTCYGESCPPCWYQKPDGIDCYEYAPGSLTCPFGGAYDCKTKKQT